MAVKRRGKKLSLYKRVPKRYESVESRKFVWLSLHTDSATEAEQKAGPAWEQLVAGWEAKLAGDTSDAEQRFQAARELAEVRGLAAGVDERIRRDLMGHALERERYGKGASLEHLQEIIQATAL